MAHCNQCGFDWTPRVESPVACTRCKRYDYQEAKKSRDGVRVPLKPVASRTEVVKRVIPETEPSALCSACEQDLVEVKGKMVCNDVSCGMFGQEQRGTK